MQDFCAPFVCQTVPKQNNWCNCSSVHLFVYCISYICHIFCQSTLCFPSHLSSAFPFFSSFICLFYLFFNFFSFNSPPSISTLQLSLLKIPISFQYFLLLLSPPFPSLSLSFSLSFSMGLFIFSFSSLSLHLFILHIQLSLLGPVPDRPRPPYPTLISLGRLWCLPSPLHAWVRELRDGPAHLKSENRFGSQSCPINS